MKAAMLSESGLIIGEAPKPEIKPNEILVRVRAAALNRADLLMSDGRMHGKLGGAGAIAGLEWAGEVAEIGSDAVEFKPGERVMCSGAGGYAEYAATDWGRASPVPAADMSFEHAATLPIALQTMHDALVGNGRLRAGETVLIQGASSGVGLMGLQIAKYLGVTFRTRSIEEVREINRNMRADLWPAVQDGTLHLPLDRVFPLAEAAAAQDHMRANAPLGKIVLTV